MRITTVFAQVLISVISANAQAAADLVIINANVRTMTSMVKAQAVAVAGNKIVAVGTNAEIETFVTKKTRKINADGKIVLPGFNDAHVHFRGLGGIFSTLKLGEIYTAEQFFSRISEYTKFLPDGRWIIGSLGSDELWKQIDSQKLDELTPHNPVFLYNVNTKFAFVNSSAIKAARLSNVKSGIVSGSELDRLRFSIPKDHSHNWEQIAETASNYVVSFGITSVQDTDLHEYAEMYRKMARDGRLKVRIYTCHGLLNWKKFADAGLKAPSGDAMVRTGCLKGAADIDEKGKAILQRDVIGADKAGMQVLLHAIGPKMNQVALDVFENAIRVNGKRDRRFRVEHAERASPSDILRFARLGIIASMQPHLFDWELTDANYYRLMRRAGVKIAFGSDAAMTDIDPIYGIFAAWKGFKLSDAISAYTVGSAYAEFQENVKGTIEPGKLADLVILSGKEFTQNNMSATMTIVDGKIVFEQ